MIDEAKIIKECLAGRPDRFEPLVNAYRESLLRVAYRYLGDWDEAKDAAQETFVKAYRSLASFHTERRFSTWLYRILINHCLDRIKSYHRKHRHSLDATMEDKREQNPLETVSQADFIKQAMANVPEKQRQAFILMELEGFTSREASEILGCAESTVRVNSMKAKIHIKKTIIRLKERSS